MKSRRWELGRLGGNSLLWDEFLGQGHVCFIHKGGKSINHTGLEVTVTHGMCTASCPLGMGTVRYQHLQSRYSKPPSLKVHLQAQLHQPFCS